MASPGTAATIQQNYQAGGITSPVGSTTLLTTSSAPIIGANPNRRGIWFANPNNDGTIIYVCPSNLAAVVGQGIPVFPGGVVQFNGDPAANINFSSGWNAIASTGSNKPVTVLEFV
jgi:hypothetical protein